MDEREEHGERIGAHLLPPRLQYMAVLLRSDVRARAAEPLARGDA
jgi:hypothetical protein